MRKTLIALGAVTALIACSPPANAGCFRDGWRGYGWYHWCGERYWHPHWGWHRWHHWHHHWD